MHGAESVKLDRHNGVPCEKYLNKISSWKYGLTISNNRRNNCTTITTPLHNNNYTTITTPPQQTKFLVQACSQLKYHLEFRSKNKQKWRNI